MLNLRPTATIRSVQESWLAFDLARDEDTASVYAAHALSAWDQGLISCLQFADACETIGEYLREHVIERMERSRHHNA